MRQHLGSFLAGIAANAVWALLGGAAVGFSIWYKSVLDAQQHAGLHLDPAGSVAASLPTVVVIVLVLAAMLLIGWLMALLRERTSHGAVNFQTTLQGVAGRREAEPGHAALLEVAAANQRERAANEQRDAAQQQLRAVQKQRDDAQAEADEYKRQRDEVERKLAKAERDPGPIFYEQVVTLDPLDQRRALGQTTEIVRARNPAFLKVGAVEQAEAQLAACKKERDDAQIQNSVAIRERDDLKARLDRCSSQFVEAVKELDDAKRQISLLKRDAETFKQQVHRLALALRKLANMGNMSDSAEAFERITAEWLKIQPLYWPVKKNLENLAGINHPAMVDLTKTFPIGPDEYRRMADLLERLAKDVQGEPLAIPVPLEVDNNPI